MLQSNLPNALLYEISNVYTLRCCRVAYSYQNEPFSMMIVVLDHPHLPHYKSPTVELVEVENECSSYNFRSLPSLCQNYQSL